MAVTVITKNNGSPLVIGLVGVSIISWIKKQRRQSIFYIVHITLLTSRISIIGKSENIIQNMYHGPDEKIT